MAARGRAGGGAEGKRQITYLAPGSSPEHPCSIDVSLSEAAELRRGLEQAIRGALSGCKFDMPQAQATLDEQGYGGLSCRVMAYDAKGTPFFATFYALDVGKGRVAVFSFMDRSAARAAAYERNKAAFERLIGAGGYSIGDGSPMPGAPLALGTPALTQEVVDRSADRVEQALGLKLTDEQRVLCRRSLQRLWRENPFFRTPYLVGLDNWGERVKRGGREGVLANVRARAEILIDVCQRAADEPFARPVLAAYTKSDPERARAGAPGAEVGCYADFGEWALGIRLSMRQREDLARLVDGDLKRGGWVAQPVAASLAMWTAGVSRLGAADRELTAAYYRLQYLRAVSHSLVGSEQFLKKVYEEEYPPLAKGAASLYEPPLTRDLTDAYAALLCLQANAVVGREVFAADDRAKDAAARRLAEGYSEFSGRLKYALAAMPQALAETRAAWPVMAEADRRACAEQWGHWLEPAGLRARQAGAIADGAALLERAVKKERADDEAWKETPQAGMWETIRLRAVGQRDQAQYNAFINAMRDRYGDAYEARYGSASK